MSGRRAALRAGMSAPDQLARVADRGLRLFGEPRLGLALLLAAGAANALAAAVPGGRAWLDSLPYASLLGLIVLSGAAAVAVRAPVAWREWRRPGPQTEGRDALVLTIPMLDPPDAATRLRLAGALRRAGYRLSEQARTGAWAVHGTRRGWSRFAGQLSHLALVLLLVGAAIGAAFGRETTFSLLPGEQAFLDAPRPGFADAVRLEAFDAAFDASGRPSRLDTEVTFLRSGEPIERRTLRVNEPGAFGGYLVHPWTYGPAAELRVTTLAGRALHDAPLPLDDQRGGRPFGLVDLPAVGTSIGVTLVSGERNEVSVTAAASGGVIDATLMTPGEERRIGDLNVSFTGFSAWVTFASRSDPGMGLLFGGAALLVAALAVAFWLPRRRITLRWVHGELRLVLRGERFDRPAGELERLRALIEAAS